MQIQKVFLIFLAISSTVIIQGCVAVLVGAGAAGTVAYVRGDLEAVEAKDTNTVFEATKKAVQQLELSLISDSKDALSAVIVVRDAEDKKITINLKSVSEDSTKISIRVGTFGSETKSRRIYNQIRENLK